jgi:hypothetical protein
MTGELESIAGAAGAADAETGATQCALFSRRTIIMEITQSASAAAAINAIVRGFDFGMIDTVDYEAAGGAAQASTVLAFRSAGGSPAVLRCIEGPKNAGKMPALQNPCRSPRSASPPIEGEGLVRRGERQTRVSVAIDSNREKQRIRRQSHKRLGINPGGHRHKAQPSQGDLLPNGNRR